MNSEIIYNLSGVGKEVEAPGEKLTILKNIDLSVKHGDSLAVMGASGSGKSTLLHILGTLDTPSWGMINFSDKDLGKLSTEERAKLRNREIGFVFQFHHLLPEFNTLENAAMPGIIAGLPKSQAFGMAEESLEQVGLGKRLKHNVTTLSGGERQRAAIARALLLRPKVLLADEPTGNLDERTGENVGELLIRLNHEFKMTMIVVTHNRDLAEKLGAIYELRGGELYAH